jgi:MFS transporter, ACS family, glucarate transporter
MLARGRSLPSAEDPLSCAVPVASEASAVTDLKPSGARHFVVVFAVTLALISYTDRVVIAQAASNIQADLALTRVQMGWVFFVFSWAYTVFEVPGGWMGDRFGAKSVLLRVVTLWSFFTAATGWAWNYVSLLVCRFLFGAGEAGCFPNLAKAFTRWLPSEERVRAQGLMWFAARWGGAVTPLLVALLLRYVSWRRAFEMFGALGLAWGALFYLWFRDHPRDHPAVNAAELAMIPEGGAAGASREPTPWRLMLGSRSVLLLWLQYFLLSYGWWFYIQWLPTYLKEARGFALQKDALQGALLAGLPLFLGGIGCLLSGQIQPALARWCRGTERARRALGVAGLGSAGALVLLSIQLRDPVAAMLAMGLAGFANDLTIPASWGACMDLGERHTGTVSGGMNMMGALGGALAGPMVAYLLKASNDNWNLPLEVAAVAYLGAMSCWFGIDPVTPIVDRSVRAARP